jgi:hypothetical protein
MKVMTHPWQWIAMAIFTSLTTVMTDVATYACPVVSMEFGKMKQLPETWLQAVVTGMLGLSQILP